MHVWPDFVRAPDEFSCAGCSGAPLVNRSIHLLERNGDLPIMETRESYLAQADRILSKPNCTKEDRSKVDALLALADAKDPAPMQLRRAKLANDELSLGIRNCETLASE